MQQGELRHGASWSVAQSLMGACRRLMMVGGGSGGGDGDVGGECEVQWENR